MTFNLIYQVRLINNKSIAERTIRVNYENQRYLIESLLPSCFSKNSNILNISSKLANPIMIKKKEIREQILNLNSLYELDELAREYLSAIDDDKAWISPRQPVPDYMFSKLLFRKYTMMLGRDNNDIQNKEIKVVSICPGWVKTAMGGYQASSTVDDAVGNFGKILTGEFFETDNDYQGKLVSGGKIVEFK